MAAGRCQNPQAGRLRYGAQPFSTGFKARFAEWTGNLPLPGPLLHRCVEEREKKRGAVQGRKARYQFGEFSPWPSPTFGAQRRRYIPISRGEGIGRSDGGSGDMRLPCHRPTRTCHGRHRCDTLSCHIGGASGEMADTPDLGFEK